MPVSSRLPQYVRYLQLFLAAVASTMVLCSCTGFHTIPVQQVQFQNGIQTRSDGNVTVSASVLTEDEARQVFGTHLSDKKIQAVWIEVTNRSDRIFFVLKSALDPDYFSAYEVAYMHQSIFHPFINEKIVKRFKDLAFKNPVPAHSTVKGFLFINRDECQRRLDLELATYGQRRQFTFFFKLHMEAPTLFDVEKQHSNEAIRDIFTEKELRKELEGLPPITTGRKGHGTGDPVNLVLVGNADVLFPAFVKRHWHVTETTTAHSVWKMLDSFIFGSTYLHSPISPLYLFNRSQDIALQKARKTVNQRNHLRLWVTPIRYQGQTVWAGTISRDVGVRFTFQSPFLVTHKIDPDIDEVRNSFGIDMLFSQNISAVGFVKGAPVGTDKNPLYNLTGDIYFTDGLRLVLFFSKKQHPFHATRFLKWEPPVGRHM